MTIPDTIYDTINDNWGSGGYAGVAPAIDSTETQRSTDYMNDNVVEVRHYTLKEDGKQVNDVYVNRHYTLDVYITTKTSAAQLTLLYDEVEYLLRNTAMTGIQLEKIVKDWSPSQWEQGRHSVILRVTVVALMSSGAVTSAAGVTASMQALLMYGSANAAWVPCMQGTSFGARSYGYLGYFSNSDANDLYDVYFLPLPTMKGTLKLYVTGVRVVVYDADAGDYVDDVLVYGLTEAATVSLTITDHGTNRTAQGDYEYAMDDIDCSGYDYMSCIVVRVHTNANDLDTGPPLLLCYYDT